MAWGIKYHHLTRDRHDILWTSKILEDGFSGEEDTLLGAGTTPLKFEFCNKSDDPFDTIKSSRAIITAWAYSMFALDELYDVENMHHKVLIKQGDDLWWLGYVDPHQCEQPYGPVPYSISIYCIDGLTLLENILYEESPGTPYNGRRLESQIVLDILTKIGFTEFKEYVNIYEAGMDSEVGDSPMDQLLIDVDIFKDMYCDEVLEKILTKYGACIKQVDGIFCIYRPKELNKDIVYGRYFIAATTKTPISITPKQYMNRAGYASTLLEVKPGKIMRQPPAKKVTINQDYGWKESWLDNWKVEGNTYNDVTGTWKYWTNVGEGLNSINDALKAEIDGFNLPGSTTPYAYHVRQSFGTASVTTVDVLSFSIDYAMLNFSGGDLIPVMLYMKIKANNNNKWLEYADENTLVWSYIEKYVWINFAKSGINKGFGGWNTAQWNIEGLPVTDSYTIWLYGPYHESSAAIMGFYKNIRFYSTSDKIILKQRKKKLYGWEWIRRNLFNIWPRPWPIERIRTYEDVEEIVERQYTKTNPINGKEVEYDCLLGDVVDSDIDNVLEQFAGALAVGRTGTLEEAAAQFCYNHAPAYAAGDVVATCDWYDIVMTSAIAGLDFTGNTTINNTHGDLSGSVVNTQANVDAQAQIDTITVLPASAGSGTAYVYCSGFLGVITWEATRALSIENFYNANVIELLAEYGVELTTTSSTLIFTAHVAGVPFTNPTYIENISGNITGTVANTQANITGQKRIDTITLSGTTGTANILCDGTTREVAISALSLSPTAIWNTRGGSENKALLQIIVDEMAEQFSRPKQFLDLPIMETAKLASALNLLGNFQDAINNRAGYLRAFIANRGAFDVKPRKWKLDLVEIGEGESIYSQEGIPANALLNDDGTPILNDDGEYILTSD